MGQKPVIILSKPSLSQNIGACARAMLNFGFSELRLIDPRANWLDKNARALSADADCVLEKATVFKTAEEAFADLQCIYATTARPRDMIKEAISPPGKHRSKSTIIPLRARKLVCFLGLRSVDLKMKILLCVIRLSPFR